jgi:ribosome-binding protein aMBF1 (putative translation factor)
MERTIDDYLVHIGEHYPLTSLNDKPQTWEEICNNFTMYNNLNDNKQMEEKEKEFAMAVFNDIAASIKSLREHQGLTIEDAAQRTGLPIKKLEAIERGTFFNNNNQLAKLIEAIGGRLAIVPEETPDDPHCQFIELED